MAMEGVFGRIWTKKDWREAERVLTQTKRLLTGTVIPHLRLDPTDRETKAVEAQCTEIIETTTAAMDAQRQMLNDQGLSEPPDD